MRYWPADSNCIETYLTHGSKPAANSSSLSIATSQTCALHSGVSVRRIAARLHSDAARRRRGRGGSVDRRREDAVHELADALLARLDEGEVGRARAR